MHASLDGNNIILTFRFDPAVIQFVRTINGRRYMQGTKTWILPLTVGEHTVRNLEKLGFSIDPRIYYINGKMKLNCGNPHGIQWLLKETNKNVKIYIGNIKL